MTMADGTTVEIATPAPDDVRRQDVHAYRVRGGDTVAEYATLHEAATHVLAMSELPVEREVRGGQPPTRPPDQP